MVGTDNRRTHERFTPQEKAYVVMRPSFSQMGKIKDISLGGLSLEYITNASMDQDWTNIDIFLSEKGFHLTNLPCRVVYDNAVQHDESLPMGLHVRRCGLQLGDLTSSQKAMLEMFLATHVEGNA